MQRGSGGVFHTIGCTERGVCRSTSHGALVLQEIGVCFNSSRVDMQIKDTEFFFFLTEPKTQNLLEQ